MFSKIRQNLEGNENNSLQKNVITKFKNIQKEMKEFVNFLTFRLKFGLYLYNVIHFSKQ